MTEERSRTEIAAWIAAGVVLLFLGWKLLAPAGGAPPAASAPPVVRAPASRSAGVVYVHVAGRVHAPGLYRLRAGARISAAIDRAGGPARGADLSAVNLAMKVQDGQQVLVPRRGGAPAAGSTGGGSGGAARISLATATVEQLDGLDGIGPTLAKR